MKVQIETLGCKVNSVESESIAKLFEQRGHTIVKRGGDAVVINTCCVTAEAEAKSRQAIRRNLKNGLKVAVMGCYSQLEPEEVRETGADVVIGTAQRSSIVDLLEEALEKPTVTKSAYETVFGEQEQLKLAELKGKFEELPYGMSRTRAFIKVQDGCNGNCTYCVIPKVRGQSRSRTAKSIIEEVTKLTDYKEIVLTGIHLGQYGQDKRSNLSRLLKKVLDNTDARVRLSSIEVNEITDDLIDLFKSYPQLCRHLHIPLQSGSEAVLEMMNRRYTTAEYTAKINTLITELPDLTIGTDVIAGFPAETEVHVQEGLKFIEALPIAYMHVFQYSPRPGTIAASMTQVNPQIKKGRAARLIALSQKKNRKWRESWLNKEVEVLTEQFKDDYTTGHSKEYLKVYLEGKVKTNKIITVEVTDIFEDGVKGIIKNAADENLNVKDESDDVNLNDELIQTIE